MVPGTNSLIDLMSDYIVANGNEPDVESIASEIEHQYPDVVDLVTTGMIATRIKEYNGR